MPAPFRIVTMELASLGRASVMFDRGDFKTGADPAERHLRRLPVKNRTERAAALELMVRACVEQGRTDEATHAVAELTAIANQARTGPLRPLASLAAGLVAARTGDPKSARQGTEHRARRVRSPEWLRGCQMVDGPADLVGGCFGTPSAPITRASSTRARPVSKGAPLSLRYLTASSRCLLADFGLPVRAATRPAARLASAAAVPFVPGSRWR